MNNTSNAVVMDVKMRMGISKLKCYWHKTKLTKLKIGTIWLLAVFIDDVVPITVMWELLSLENLMILRKSGLERMNRYQNFQNFHTGPRLKLKVSIVYLASSLKNTINMLTLIDTGNTQVHFGVFLCFIY